VMFDPLGPESAVFMLKQSKPKAVFDLDITAP
jgi:hypothetical protein